MGDSQADERTTPTAFVRESTGLVKNVSFFDSIAMNMSNMSVGALLGVIGISGLIPMFFAGVDMAGVNLVLLSVIAFAVSLPQVVIYTMMSRRYPRTGGDYVYVSRNLGGPLGSILSFMGYTTETTAYLGLIVLSTVFAIGSVGLFFTFDPNLLGLAVPSGPITDPAGLAMPSLQFLVGAVIFAALVAINILKPKAGYKVVSTFTIFGFFSILLAMGVLLSAGSTGVQNYINSAGGAFAINGSSTFNVVSSQYPGGSFSWASNLFLLPLMAAFVYPWLNASPAVASEIKGGTARRWNVPISAFLVFAFLTSALGVMYLTAGQAFTNAAYSNPTLVFGLPPAATSFNFWTLAMGVSGNSVIAGIIGLGWIVANMSVLAYGIIVISRYLLAQSFDRFLPSRISTVSPRFGSPYLALLISLIVTVALVGFAAFAYSSGGVGGADALFGAIIASMIYFIFVSLSAVIHGLKKEHGLSKLILVAAGIVNIPIFGYLAYEFLAYPGVWSLDPLTYYFVIGSVVVGALLYAGSWWYNKKRGIDISLAYRELPPE
ncbi:MAG: APC family permease [Nitrososphaerota archaeon]|nr:APC family permease [Nitrososphaerota archaeon]